MAKPAPGEVQRRITYRLYPSHEQAAELQQRLKLHAELYNAAIEERREAWRLQQVSRTYYDQQNQLPDLKRDRPDFVPLGSHALQETLRRVDRAFAAFFRRVKAGQTPGFPRFKSWRRFSGWTWPDPAGWRFEPGADGKHGRLFIGHLGAVKARGQARTLGTPVSCTISYRQGRWYASVVVNCTPVRQAGTEAVGLDLGCEKVGTLSNGKRIENPRHLQGAMAELKTAQRAVSRKRNLRSQRRRLAVAKVAKLHAKVANYRKDFLHWQTARLVRRYGLIATEQLNIKAMTAHGGRHKAGLNRSLLDVGMATFLGMLSYKAAEAGSWVVEVPTRTVKPSQTCPHCWFQAKKELSERVHACSRCGYTADRDVAAAQVMLAWALGSRDGDRPGAEEAVGLPMKRETATTPLAVGGR